MMDVAKTHRSFSRVSVTLPSTVTTEVRRSTSQSGFLMFTGNVMDAMDMGSTMYDRISRVTAPLGKVNGAGVMFSKSSRRQTSPMTAPSETETFGGGGAVMHPRYFSHIFNTRFSSNAPTSTTVNCDGSANAALKCSQAFIGTILRTSATRKGALWNVFPYTKRRMVWLYTLAGSRLRFRMACSCILSTASSSSGTSIERTS
mmetsp:Transcript_7201/g.30671  ORF Transcript_7201/g.30671 Transcript_7201/m.30671 type:complete len:202 (+) Transcript_7201:670-1275(+)